MLVSIRAGAARITCGHVWLTYAQRQLAKLTEAEQQLAAGSWRVSSCGRVRSSTGRVSYGAPLRSGYLRVAIEGRFYFVHRLVAAEFLPPPQPGQWQVNHKDLDPSNNNLSNLQYVSPAQNVQHSWQTNPTRRTGLQKPVMWRACGQQSWSTCASQQQLASLISVSQQTISRCCRGLVQHVALDGGSVLYEVKFADRVSHHPPASGLSEEWRYAKHPNTGSILPGLMVSNCGRLWSSRRGNCWLGCLSNGYYRVNTGSGNLYVHRVVLCTFLGRPDADRFEVNHKDCDRGNNCVQNLEYVTRSENMKHSYIQKVGQPRKITNGKPVQGRRLSCDGPWQNFLSIGAAALHAGVSRHTVSKICKGQALPCRDWDFSVHHGRIASRRRVATDSPSCAGARSGDFEYVESTTNLADASANLQSL